MSASLHPEARTAPRSSAPPPPEPPRPLVPLVPPGGHFEGEVAFRGQARIDGEVVGHVKAEGRLELGPSARVEGDLEIDEAVIEGRVEGEIHARSRVAIRGTGNVRGNVVAPLLEIDEGGILQGRCRTGEAARSAAEEPGDGDSLP